ncbi:MAG: PorP/SprF family type IX secretion system membrane protein [Bacteroidota bacterium]
MRLIKTLLFTFFTLIGTFTLSAQDIHYTLFDMSPLALNPALTGAFEGTARIGGIYRDQWASIIDNQYTTPTFYIDAPIVRGIRKQDWIGIGVSFFQDEAGSLSLQTSGALFSISYHLALKKDQSSVLTLGLQGGRVSTEVNLEGALDGELLQGQVDGNANAGGEFTSGSGTMMPNENYFDIGVGLLYRSQMNEKTNLEIGVSGGHVTSPQFSLVTGGEQGERPIRINAFASVGYGLNERWGIQPKLFFQNTGGFSETYIQAWGNYLVNKEDDFTLNFGLGYRIGDAAKTLLGADYKGFRAGLAYDITLSSLSEVNNGQGAFEIALSYILKIYKDPVVKPAVFCPKF